MNNRFILALFVLFAIAVVFVLMTSLYTGGVVQGRELGDRSYCENFAYFPLEELPASCYSYFQVNPLLVDCKGGICTR